MTTKTTEHDIPHHRVSGLGNPDLGDLAAEGFRLELAKVVVLHPVHGEQVTQARTDILALHHSRITTVRSPRRLVCVRGGNCKDLAVRLLR